MADNIKNKDLKSVAGGGKQKLSTHVQGNGEEKRPAMGGQLNPDEVQSLPGAGTGAQSFRQQKSKQSNVAENIQ